VDDVDPEIGEDEEERDLEKVVPHSRAVCGCIIQFGVTKEFAHEERGGENGHDGKGDEGLGYFLPYLVLEKFRVLRCVFVENEVVGQGGEDEVNKETKQPCDQK